MANYGDLHQIAQLHLARPTNLCIVRLIDQATTLS